MGALQQVNLDTIQCERMYFFLFLNKRTTYGYKIFCGNIELIRIYYFKKVF